MNSNCWNVAKLGGNTTQAAATKGKADAEDATPEDAYPAKDGDKADVNDGSYKNSESI